MFWRTSAICGFKGAVLRNLTIRRSGSCLAIDILSIKEMVLSFDNLVSFDSSLKAVSSAATFGRIYSLYKFLVMPRASDTIVYASLRSSPLIFNLLANPNWFSNFLDKCLSFWNFLIAQSGEIVLAILVIKLSVLNFSGKYLRSSSYRLAGLDGPMFVVLGALAALAGVAVVPAAPAALAASGDISIPASGTARIWLKISDTSSNKLPSKPFSRDNNAFLDILYPCFFSLTSVCLPGTKSPTSVSVKPCSPARLSTFS